MLDVKKILKKAVKRKVRVTDALIISFLISGNITYGEDFINDQITQETIVIQNTDVSLINTGAIFVNKIVPEMTSNNLGNGFYSNFDLKTIENNGLILGSISGHYNDENNIFQIEKSGNGIYLESDKYVENLFNKGYISGNSIIQGEQKGTTNPIDPYSGNGISSAGYIENISNAGIILGKSNVSIKNYALSWYSGNGISLTKSIDATGPSLSIINNGIISGYNKHEVSNDETQFHGSGNGVYSFNSMGNVSNKGIVSGHSTAVASQISGKPGSGYVSFSGNGIYSGEGTENISNKGLISGYLNVKEGNLEFYYYSHYNENGNGIIIGTGYNNMPKDRVPEYLESLNISNEGIISGYGEITLKTTIHHNGTFAIGSGISVNAPFNETTINNTGLIKGTYSALSFFNSATALNSTVNNYGILSGAGIFRDADGSWDWKTKPEINLKDTINSGLHIYLTPASETLLDKRYELVLDSNGNPSIQKIILGTGGLVNINGTNKDIINGSTTGAVNLVSNTINGNVDLFINSSNLNENSSDLIINGVGRETGALTVNSDISLENSTINGYETALYIQDNKSFTGTNIILNGGGLKNDIAIIKGSSKNNTLEILGESVINGSTDLGAGDDKLTLDNSVQINGTLTGGTGDDTLNLGLQNSNGSLSIYHNISDFETINTNGNITIYETVNITGANNINIASGNLTFRIDPTLKDEKGFITGHAFYQQPIATFSLLNEPMAIAESPTITSTGGYLVLGLNGLGENSTINMGGYTLIPDIDDKWWKPSDYLTTDSLVLDAKLKDDGNILVTIKESIPLEPPINPEDPKPPVNPSIDPELYAELNKVYQSIVNAGEIGVLANTTLLEGKTYEEALEALLSILDQIHANNPYAYTLKSSRDSLKLFEDNLSYLTIKPKENEWIVQGKGFYSGVKNDNSKSSEGCYEFNKAYRNYETKTSFSGGLATAEYGLTNDSSVGFVLGGGHQSTDFKGSSKIKGNSLYLGAFAKKEVNQFKFMSGIGYQYGSLKGERVVTNKYNYFKTDDRYDVNSFNVFVEAKYDYALNNDWTLSPKAKLSWYYVSQDSVNEGYEPGNLSLKVDSATGTTGDLEIGFDLKNTLALNSGKLSNILSVGLINTIGDREKDLTGNILGAQKNGNSFDIRGIELPRTSGKLSYNLEYEKTNGMIYTLGVGYEFAKDNNKNVTGTLGLGYKF